MLGRTRSAVIVATTKDVQERVGKEKGEREDHEEPEGCMDQCHVKRTAVRRGVIDEEGNVGVDEQEEEDTEEDGREEEQAQDLGRVRHARARRGVLPM